ncbi:nitrogenase molybdenum-iron protein alpha chain [Thermosulfuriphilus ammonigenes]|uniref:Nitrogenase protein alpha chain n=1 Tax=Thermosulfuriphilus ammonigenes TaxID=1936021 RepID=A0A6G7PUM0_9BACT|nr:nitrogenase molybdenum-iron protein alpha chain [Thermosulfuriphilus ammonigenes]MBA2848605.1 nitrogenase molybdenum-iron protein alpha chain [Thermosulfuriphilus ammonigenes]QIJ71256.1 nitrogenase molybdenum-iron protein alpha chain [Thermosulfuriphilus ammonigenes]
MADLRLKKAPAVDPHQVVEEIISLYPAKVAKKRRKHIVVRDPSQQQQIEANVRTVPGIITQRGCCYAGCKGVVIGPIVDMVHIVHGPIGCSFYAWATRRNQGRPREDGHYYLHYCFSTDMQEDDIIFGGEKKLRAAIEEAYRIFKPKAISVHATCPVGLIGDDIQTVAKEMSQKLGIQVVAFNCEGYRGVSQSAGHHIANNGLFKHIVGLDDVEVEGYTVNCLGEYNIGGDAWEIERILERCGIKVLATFSGNASYDELRRAHMAQLNLVQCHRSINYMAEMMETRFGIPWMKVNFIGVKATSKTLRKLATFFDDPKLTERIEQVIAEEEAEAERQIAPYRKRLEGKTAMLFVGGSRSHHYQDLFRDLGMETIVAGYEFAHRDDYEGRQVLPFIKIDADSRNIEELHVEPDPERFRLRKPEEILAALKEAGIIDYYEGMMPDMPAGSIVIDDISHAELEILIRRFKPDIVCSGIKDKYIIEKFGIPSKQLHNYDYSGPYAGYRGAVNFAREIDMMINNPAWSYIRPPWEKTPVLKAEPVTS